MSTLIHAMTPLDPGFFFTGAGACSGGVDGERPGEVRPGRRSCPRGGKTGGRPLAVVTCGVVGTRP
ncbi:hypothetical protein Ssi02_64740 [Sinosporangium siamense]|uniref:Uncharacterized protein n=1 Tax=Sinosporangium siamense TaxID=1367973 RepID=A0A919VAA8_9ACTN|nr:hypothetical protein Ssi02_64740 [Sinosporangium siamense]